jgi:RHS repeat-associated protein
MGSKTTFDYSGMDAATGSGVVRVTDADGNANVYNYTQGALAAQTSLTATTVTAEQDFGPNLAAGGNSGGTLLNAWVADADGNITTVAHDQAGNVTSVTRPDGIGGQTATTSQWSTSLKQPSCGAIATATSTCSASQAGPAPLAPGGVITPPSSAPPPGVTYGLYDTDGNQLYATTGVYQPGSSTASYSQTSYSLFKGNSVTLNGTNISCTTNPPSASLPCATINANGVVIQLAYDAQGDLTSSSTPDGNGTEIATTTYGYNGDGQQTSLTSPDGNLTSANAGNYTTTTAYNPDGQTTSVTLAGGTGATVTPRTTSYGYDADGNQTTSKDARGFTTTTAYNADDKRAMVTDPDGNATLTCYDGVGDVTQTVPPVGVAANSLTPASCPSAYPAGYGTRLAADATTWTFDSNREVTARTTPAPAGQSGSETTSYSYDGNGNLTTTTQPPTSNGGANQVTTYAYNAAGQLAAKTAGYGTTAASTTSYCYDPNGDTTAVVAPDGNTTGTATCETASPWAVPASTYPTQAAFQTTYSYDSAGDIVSTTRPATAAAPNGATTTYAYDPNGNTLSTTDPNNVTATYTYTPAGSEASVSYSGSSAHSVGYTYDANGSLTAMTDATGSSSNIYDPFGELTSATHGSGQTVGYGYDADGNVTGVTYPLPAGVTWPASDTVSYGYDNAGELTSVTDFNNNKITIGNTADGMPNSLGLASTSDTVATTYDPTDATASVSLKNSSSTLQSFSYADAPSGSVLTETDTPSSPSSPAAYSYDSQSRVTSMTPGTGSQLTYGLDASGNLTTLPAGASGTYDNASELTSSALSGVTTSYTYDADGQRLTAKQGATTVASGTWNGAGQLTAYSDPSARMSTASYDGTGLRASATTTPTGGTASTQNFVWAMADTPRLLMDSTNAYIYGATGTPIEQVSLSSGTVSYLVSDALGSVRGIVSATGTLAASTSYDAWGNPQTTGGLTAQTPFGFAGGYTDPTGLIYLINRYYDPATGQFTSLDPAVSSTQEPYGYAGDNPVSATDPNGLTKVPPGNGYCPSTSPGCPGYQPPAPRPNPQPNPSPTPVPVSRWSLSEFFGNIWHGAVHSIESVWGYVRKHWRGELQLAGLAACLVGTLGYCAGAALTGAVLRYLGDSLRDNNFRRHLPALAENIGVTIFTGVAGKMLEGGKGIGSWQDFKDYVKASPWARFGKHSFTGGWRAGEFDFVGSTIFFGEHLVLGLLGIAGGLPDSTPSPTPGPPGGG